MSFRSFASGLGGFAACSSSSPEVSSLSMSESSPLLSSLSTGSGTYSLQQRARHFSQYNLAPGLGDVGGGCCGLHCCCNRARLQLASFPLGALTAPAGAASPAAG